MHKLAIDTGGTFTDIIVMDASGELSFAKVSSTPRNYADGIIQGIRQALGEMKDYGVVIRVVDETKLVFEIDSQETNTLRKSMKRDDAEDRGKLKAHNSSGHKIESTALQ